MKGHPIQQVKTIGEYKLCKSCLRAVALVDGQWQHIRRVAWTDAAK